MPVTLDLRLTVVKVPLKPASRIELPHTIEDRTRRGNIVECHEITYGNQVELIEFSQYTKRLERG